MYRVGSSAFSLYDTLEIMVLHDGLIIWKNFTDIKVEISGMKIELNILSVWFIIKWNFFGNNTKIIIPKRCKWNFLRTLINSKCFNL